MLQTGLSWLPTPVFWGFLAAPAVGNPPGLQETWSLTPGLGKLLEGMATTPVALVLENSDLL